MGGSSLAPEVIAQTARRAARRSSTRPRPARCSPRSTATPRRAASRRPCSSSRRSPARPSRPTQPSARLRGGVPRPRHRPDRAHRRRDRPGLAARRGRPRRRLPRLQRRPDRRRPLLGAHRVRARAVGLAGVDIAELLDEAEATSSSRSRSTAPTTPRSCSPPRSPAATPRRDKLGLVTDGTHIVGLADWIEQLVAESTGKEGTGILPVVLLPVSPEVETEPRRPAGRASRRRGRRFHFREHHDRRDPRQRVARRAARRVGVRHGDRRTDARDQPVRPARRRVGQDRRARPARRTSRAGTAPAFVAEGVEVRVSDPALARLRHRRRRARRAPGRSCPTTATSRSRHTSTASTRPSSAGLRELVAARLRPPRHVRLGSPLPALDRPVPQGRTRERRLPADPRAHRRRPRDPRPPVHVRPAHRGAGRRRRERARRATAGPS